MSSHVYSFPPRCCECKKFMPHNRSKMVREYTGTQMQPDCDDMEIGMCEPCEDRISEELWYQNQQNV